MPASGADPCSSSSPPSVRFSCEPRHAHHLLHDSTPQKLKLQVVFLVGTCKSREVPPPQPRTPCLLEGVDVLPCLVPILIINVDGFGRNLQDLEAVCLFRRHPSKSPSLALSSLFYVSSFCRSLHDVQCCLDQNLHVTSLLMYTKWSRDQPNKTVLSVYS